MSKRLDLAGIAATIDEFLPESEALGKDLQEGKRNARLLAEKKFPNPTGTQIETTSRSMEELYISEVKIQSRISLFIQDLIVLLIFRLV